MLNSLPTCLQVKLLFAMITPDKVLKAVLPRPAQPVCNPLATLFEPEVDTVDAPFINALTLMPSSPSLMTSLQVYGGSWSDHAGHQASVKLAQALCHHSSLASLTLQTACNGNTVQQLAAALYKLTSLQSLHLGHVWAAECVPTLKRALFALTQLQDLSMGIRFEPPRLKRERDEAAASPPSDQLHPQSSLSAMLSTASHLTSLSLRILPLSDDTCSSAATFHALNLPNLSLFSVQASSTWACLLLNSIRAPLTSLTIKSDSIDHFNSDEAKAAVQGFPQALLQHKRLLRLHFRRATQYSWPAWALPVIFNEDSYAPPALQQLQVLALDTCFRTFQTVSPLLRSACPALQALGLAGFHSPEAASAWSAILADLRPLQLSRLSLSVNIFDRDDMRRPGFPPQLAALSELRCLSALRLTGVGHSAYSCRLSGPVNDDPAASFRPELHLGRRYLTCSPCGVPAAAVQPHSPDDLHTRYMQDQRCCCRFGQVGLRL